jgi:uncharacterized protein YjaG (DUF416 family)
MKFKEEELSESQRILFLYAICRRIGPFFRDFSNKFSIDDSELLDECLREMEEEIFKNNSLKILCQKWIPRLESATPDMEDYNSELLPSLALDSVAATLTTLDYFSTQKNSLIDEVLSISLNSAEFIDDSIDEFISLYKRPKKNVVALEIEFIDRLKLLVKDSPADAAEKIKYLISEYAYQ